MRLYNDKKPETETQDFASLHVMADQYQHTYRVQSARAPWHNYDGGVYFITICTRDFKHYFGDITHHIMNLSPIGRIAKECIEAIPNHFPHVEVPLYVIMPNHIHCILIINDPQMEKKDISSDRPHNEYGPQSMNLASVIRGFKVGVTKLARKKGLAFAWQPRFHDHIIRNNDDWNRIAEYIENNVGRWDMDKLNCEEKD